MKTLASNKRAFFDYTILEKIEAGISLLGFEVKAAKTGRISIKGSYVMIKKGEAFLTGAVIPPYQPKNTPSDYNPQRDRRLLLKKKELDYLIEKKKEQGLTLVPLKVYTTKGLIKIEIALAKGKRRFDKRQAIREREEKRKIRRALKQKT